MHIFNNPNFDFVKWKWHAIAVSWIVIIDLNCRAMSRTSSIGLPLIATDIIDAEDWLIEQPWPEILRSRTFPSSSTSR